MLLLLANLLELHLLIHCRKTRSSMHCVYVGSQVLAIFLGWHESVRAYRNIGSRESAYWDCCILLHADSTKYEIHRQPILADEIQTFKALITIHKVLQEGHPIAVREAQPNNNWLESLTRGIFGDGIRGRSSDHTRWKALMSTWNVVRPSELMSLRLWATTAGICIFPVAKTFLS